ncbi:MAG: hypothetical protein GX591_14780, partial [Planctomycetes bacterium]|nr:hypothetical protein [Planctomycetota bacterium]
QAWLFSEQGANWADYDFTFDAVNNYITRGSGVMVLAQDRDNYYWLDISSSNGRLVRFIDGTAVELARDADIELPYHGLQVYKVSVRHGEGDITIAVDTHNDGTEDFSYTDTTPLAVARFTAGGIGFHFDGVANRYHGIHYDSIRVDVLARADPVVPGDCDSDDDVDLDDFVILKQNFGRSGVTAGAAEGDLDVDGDVDLDDLVVLKQNFGR